MDKAREIIFAVVGAGDFAVEKIRRAGRVAASQPAGRYYQDFVTRGRSLSDRVKNSASTKQAIAQTKTARTQVKAAATSVTKAVRANAKATKSAAKKPATSK